MTPGVNHLTDPLLEEWFSRPAALASYSAGRLSGARSGALWHGTLSEMGMVVISSTLAVGPISHVLSASGEPIGEAGQGSSKTISPFARGLTLWDQAA